MGRTHYREKTLEQVIKSASVIVLGKLEDGGNVDYRYSRKGFEVSSGDSDSSDGEETVKPKDENSVYLTVSSSKLKVERVLFGKVNSKVIEVLTDANFSRRLNVKIMYVIERRHKSPSYQVYKRGEDAYDSDRVVVYLRKVKIDVLDTSKNEYVKRTVLKYVCDESIDSAEHLEEIEGLVKSTKGDNSDSDASSSCEEFIEPVRRKIEEKEEEKEPKQKDVKDEEPKIDSQKNEKKKSGACSIL